MAVLKSIATGNFTAAGTWGVVDATSYNNTETTTTALTTSYAASTGATTGVITVEGIAVKLSVRTGTTGTMSVHLAIAGVEVVGSLVTINTADLPVAATADINGGWIYFKFAAGVVLAGATSYTVEAKTSSASQVSLFSTATTNWARALVTTTTQAPAAGDDLIVAGEYTAASTSATYTVTMDNTATTDFGAASTSLVTPSLAICSKGVLTYGTTASTAYYLKQSGNVIVYSGGILNTGTVATPMPSTSSGVLEFDCGANVDFGLTIRNGGTWVGQGATKTTVKTLLNTDEAAAATVIGVVATSGWAVSDELAFASTTRTATQCEKKTILTVDSGVQVTLTAGLTNAHSGTSPTQGEVGNLTRNVRIRGISTSLQGYIDIKGTASVDLDYVEIYQMGSAVASKQGIVMGTTASGSCSIRYCGIHDFIVTGSYVAITGSITAGIVFSNNVVYNINNYLFQIATPTSGVHTIDSNLFMLNVAGGIDGVIFNDVSSNFTNNTVVGSTRHGIYFYETGSLGTFTGNTVHSTANSGIRSDSSAITGTISGGSIWRNSSFGLLISAAANNLTLASIALFGNTTSNISISPVFNVVLDNITSNGDTTFSTSSGMSFGSLSSSKNIRVTNSNFGTVSGILTAHTQDIIPSNAGLDVYLENTILASATEVSSFSTAYDGSSISSQKHDQTAGLHKAWYKYGIITIDTTAGLHDVTPSVRITPNSASSKIEAVILKTAVLSGKSATVFVKVRESVVGDGTDYNGNRIRLIVKKNVAAGISADTVLATATASSVGAFEIISGTTATVTDDCILEFSVDCNGTTGWVNVDTFTAPGSADTLGMKFWKDGVAFANGNNSGGRARYLLGI